MSGRFLRTGRGLDDWRLQRLELGNVGIEIGTNSVGCIYHGVSRPGSLVFYVPPSFPEEVALDGQRFERGGFSWVAPTREVHICRKGAGRWLALGIDNTTALQRFDREGLAIDTTLFENNHVGRVDMRSTTDLTSFACRAFAVEARNPGILRAGAAREAFRQELLDLLLRALHSIERRGARGRGRPRIARRIVLARALGLVESCADQNLHVDDLCRAGGVSWTTLNVVFREYLGMSPHRYLMVRRLHAIRTALDAAGPDDTVSEICGRYGVWDIGRFAAQFHRMFGLLPSQMLRQRR